jgi:CNT family concentrative nucleoside transporter
MGQMPSSSDAGTQADVPPSVGTPPPEVSYRSTPYSWRLTIGVLVVGLGTIAYLSRDVIGPRAQAACGLLCFVGIVAALSMNLRAVNWRTIVWGFALQVFLALFVMKFEVHGLGWLGIEDGTRPGYEFFEVLTKAVKQLLTFTNAGSRFVFGPLADPDAMGRVFPSGFVFAFSALPTIIFIASFFSVLYYFGVLQWVVGVMARVMAYLLGTSGAETLSVSANVFIGQTEAPLIVRPYVPGMTQSELLTMMVGGMAHISGGLMAVYIGMGADPVAILATSVMAAPGTLYLSKLFLPETGQPATRGVVKAAVEQSQVNVIDAASSGASEGMRLAINIAAMLIAFLAFIAMFDYILHWLGDVLYDVGWIGEDAVLRHLSLRQIFSWIFAPVALLMGVEPPDIGRIGDLLGTKLVANEFVAFVEFQEYKDLLSPRSRILATYALTGFANFASIGIQIGGIGAMAPSRRHDLARLGGRALLVGFLVTLINAALAGIMLD